MLILAATQNTQPDPVALVMALALLAFVAFLAVRKSIRSKKAPVTAAAEVTIQAEPAGSDSPDAPGTAGELKLHTVSPKTAAMLMAIVANKTGKPLNELRFISIKEVETK